MFRLTLAGFTVALLVTYRGCNPPSSAQASVGHARAGAEGARIEAAETLAERYARWKAAKWKLQARAAGTQCGVLLVQVGTVADESMIEGIHYGAGMFDASPGGAQKLQREHAFNGVAYTDTSGRVWTYDDIAPAEVPTLVPCH